MSEENVELAREGIEAFNRGDIDWLLERIDDDFVFDWSRSRSPLRGVYRGADGIAGFLREQWNSFEEFVIEPREFIDRGRHVVVPLTLRARGRQGIAVEHRQHAGVHRRGRACGARDDVPGDGRGVGGDRRVSALGDTVRTVLA